MFEHQRTLKAAVSIQGIGLHTGAAATMTFQPSPANSGIQFARMDLPGHPKISADVAHVRTTQRGTTLEKDGVAVHTVEHVLATLAGFGIDNCLVELTGPEPPILDGSAREFARAISEAGVHQLNARRHVFAPEAPVFYENGHTSLVILPHEGFKISCTIEFPNQRLESQYMSLEFDENTFVKELAPARTFCFYEEVKPLMETGLIKGGSLDCAIVIKNDEILSKEALRFRDEFVRHKILDILGDITLLGQPIHGHIIAMRPGHAANVALTQRLSQIIKKKRGIHRYLPEGAIYESMDIQELLEIIPHRYPFVMVDRVISMQDRSVVALKNVTINEPYFQGHFPGHPVMPGVLQVEAMAQVAGLLTLRHSANQGKIGYFLSADKVKFRKPVVPGDTLIIEVHLTKARGNKLVRAEARILVEDEVVSEAELMFSILERRSGFKTTSSTSSSKSDRTSQTLPSRE